MSNSKIHEQVLDIAEKILLARYWRHQFKIRPVNDPLSSHAITRTIDLEEDTDRMLLEVATTLSERAARTNPEDFEDPED